MSWKDILTIYESTLENILRIEGSEGLFLQIGNALSEDEALKNFALSGGGLYAALRKAYEPMSSTCHLATQVVESIAQGLEEDPDFVYDYLSKIIFQK